MWNMKTYLILLLRAYLKFASRKVSGHLSMLLDTVQIAVVFTVRMTLQYSATRVINFNINRVFIEVETIIRFRMITENKYRSRKRIKIHLSNIELIWLEVNPTTATESRCNICFYTIYKSIISKTLRIKNLQNNNNFTPLFLNFIRRMRRDNVLQIIKKR